MNNLTTITIHEPWGFERLYLYIKDAFRVLNEAYNQISKEKKNTPYSKPIGKKKWDMENILTEDLVRTAEKIPTELEYIWDNESKNLENRTRIDITIIYSLSLGFEYRLCIECKRLNKTSSLCKAYVKNGIQRFVSGYYSAKMPIAGMIGYVLADNTTKIIPHINRTLDEKSTQKILTEVSMHEGNSHIYLSVHSRTYSTFRIKIYHLMLDYTELVNHISDLP